MANQASLRISGLTKNEMIGRKCHEIFHGTDMPADSCPHEALCKTGICGSVDMEMEALNRTFIVSCTPILDDAGEIDRIIHVATDITTRRRAKEELEESQNFLRNIISNAGEGIIVYDAGFRYLLWNSIMEEITGVKAEEVIGRVAYEVFPHLKDHGVDILLNEAMEGNTVRSAVVPFESPSSGRTGWVTGIYSPMKDFDGNIIGVIGIIRDVTEQTILEKKLEESQ